MEKSFNFTVDSGYHEDENSAFTLVDAATNEFGQRLLKEGEDILLIRPPINEDCDPESKCYIPNEKNAADVIGLEFNWRCWILPTVLTLFLLSFLLCIIINRMDCCAYSESRKVHGNPLCRSTDCSIFA
ncbi:hypothetical protein ACOME3_002662 [Neoechinorhynchus agilis]